METDNQRYHQIVTDFQSTLYAFICSLMGGSETVRDVLQEVNLVLWSKAEEYDSSRDFRPWAFRIAYLQVLAFRRRQQRDRLIFNDALIGTIAAEFVEDVDSRLAVLDRCIDGLAETHRELLRQHYEEGQSPSSIAESMGRTANAVAASLYRIRRVLAECVERGLRLEGVG